MLQLVPFSICNCLLAAGLALAAVPADAQTDLESTWMASRTVLERRADELDRLAASTAYSDRARKGASDEAERIRRRLVEGDFRIGDKIFVSVEGAMPSNRQMAPTTLSDLQDTVTVLEGSRVNIRGIGEIELTGVLRSELQNRINTAVNEVILNSRATTRPLVRLAVFGNVGRPGYYTVPMETRLDALVMMAGGPTPDAATDMIRLVRGDTIVLDEYEVRRVIAEGLVVGELQLREGDQVTVAQGTEPLDRRTTLQYTFLFLSPLVTTLVVRLLR